MAKTIIGLVAKTLLVVLALNFGAKALSASTPAAGLEFSTPTPVETSSAHGPCIPGHLYRIGNPHGTCIPAHAYRISMES